MSGDGVGATGCGMASVRVDNRSDAGDALYAISAAMEVRTIAGGTAVSLPAAQSSIVNVIRGATKLVARAAVEREQVSAFNFAGDLVLVPGSGPHVYALHTLCEVELGIAPYQALRAAIANRPALLARLLDNCDAALGRCREKALMIGRKTAAERMAGFLVLMAARIGTMRGGQVALDLPMSRRDIGDSLGLTIETVSRQFSEMRECRLIETEGRSKVRLLDLAGLRKRAGHLRETDPAFSDKFALDQCWAASRGLGGLMTYGEDYAG